MEWLHWCHKIREMARQSGCGGSYRVGIIRVAVGGSGENENGEKVVRVDPVCRDKHGG